MEEKSICLKFTLIVIFWKKVKEKQFYWKRNCCFSVLAVLVLLLVVNFDQCNREDTIQTNENFDQETQSELYSFNSANTVTVYYTPKGDLTEIITGRLKTKLSLADVRGIDNEHQLQPILNDVNISRFIIVSFHFPGNATELPDRIAYTLRVRHNGMETHTQYLTAVRDSYFRPDQYSHMDFPYRQSGFLAVKLVIDTELVKMLERDRTSAYEISLTKYPQPPKQRPVKINLDAAVMLVPVIVVALYLFLTILPSIEAKATGFDEHLKTVTRFSYLNDVVIYTVNLVQILLIVLVMFVVFAVYDLFGCINIGYPLFFVVFFITAMMSFTFMLRAAFESVVTATLCVPLICLLPVFIFDRISRPSIKGLEICFPINVFLLGIDLFRTYLNTEHCFDIDDVFRDTHPNGSHSYFQLCLALIVSSVVYLFLAWVITIFFPGKYGTPVNIADLFGRKVIEEIGADGYQMTDFGNRKLEPVDDGNRPLVKIENLWKIFKTLLQPPNTAVCNVSLDIYENQITVLVGHNGAGKTTTLSMLTGKMSWTSGKISVDGCLDVESFHRIIGICPQQNAFVPYLTCMEHLLLFGQLRGLSPVQVRRAAQQIIADMSLTAVENMQPHKLSCRMQRCLLLSLALIGDTKLLVLDEPTAGLDPESRRELWDVLLRLKQTKSILITTHDIVEADVLGDKIAVMVNGEVIACGTSMFLKQEYGIGYTLKLQKTDVFDSEPVLDLIRDTIPGAMIKESADRGVMCVVLPYENQGSYKTVFKGLEARSEELGIASIGVSNTTIEEVLLNISTTDESTATDSIDNLISAECKQANSKGLMWQQFQAILYKNIVCWKHNWTSLISMLLFVTIALPIIFAFSPGADELATNQLSMAKLLRPQVLVVAGMSRESPQIIRLLELFKQNVERAHGQYIELQDTDLNEVLLNISRTDKLRYNENVVAAFKVSLIESKRIRIEAFYTRNIIHSVAIALNLAMNVIIQFYSYGSYTIDVINAPVIRLGDISSEFSNLSMFAIFIPSVLVIVLFFYIRLRYNDFWAQSKPIQNVSAYVYWAGNWLFDVALFFVLCLYVILLAMLLHKDGWFTASEYATLLPIFSVFGCAYLLIIYVASQVFQTINGCITFLSYTHLLTFNANLFLNRHEYPGLVAILYLLPDFALRHTLFGFANRQGSDDLHSRITQFFLSMMGTLVILSVSLLFVCENIYVRDRWNSFKHQMKTKLIVLPRTKWAKWLDGVEVDEPLALVTYRGDEEINERRDLVKQLEGNKQAQIEANYSVVVRRLTKKYLDFLAVGGIDFAVKTGDCFGLFGMNGAGKTTTLKMMGLSETITDGSIEVNKINLRNDPFHYKSQFGYCPQGDALNPLMTPYEILKYTTLTRGVPRHLLTKTVDYWLNIVDIKQYRDRPVQCLSSGTKRKLSMAVAMVGWPSLIILDESTTGVDPTTRRTIWSCIQEYQQYDKTVVLASSSMAECERLCNQVAGMDAGHLTCLGSPQQLRNKCGKWFELTIKLKAKAAKDKRQQDELKTMMTKLFASSLQSEKVGIWCFLICAKQIVWSNVFSKIFEMQKNYAHSFEGFCINEVNVQESFLQFKCEKPNSNFSLHAASLGNLENLGEFSGNQHRSLPSAVITNRSERKHRHEPLCLCTNFNECEHKQK